MAIFPADDPALIDAIVTATNSLYQTHNFGQGGRSAMAGLGAGGFAIAKPPPLNGQTAIMVPLIYHGPEDAARKAFEPILSLPKLLMNTAAMLDYPAINHLLDVPPGLRVSMKGSAFTLPVAPRFAHELLASFEALHRRRPGRARHHRPLRAVRPGRRGGGGRATRTARSRTAAGTSTG